MDERDDYVLGRNVTKQALGKEGLLTSVVSIRLSSEEMDAVNIVAEREGKTFTQVVREAIRQMNSAKRSEYAWISPMSLSNGAWSEFGDPGAVRDYKANLNWQLFTSGWERVNSEERGGVFAASPGA